MQEIEYEEDEYGFKNPVFRSKNGKKIALKNKQFSDENRRKTSEVRTGRKHTAETRRKTSEAHAGLLAGEKHPMYGKHHTAKTRKKLSEANKGKKGINTWSKGRKLSAEHRIKISNSIKGEKNPIAKLTEAQVREIKIALANGESGAALARKYCVGQDTISLIKRGKNWSHVEVNQ